MEGDKESFSWGVDGDEKCDHIKNKEYFFAPPRLSSEVSDFEIRIYSEINVSMGCVRENAVDTDEAAHSESTR